MSLRPQARRFRAAISVLLPLLAAGQQHYDEGM